MRQQQEPLCFKMMVGQSKRGLYWCRCCVLALVALIHSVLLRISFEALGTTFPKCLCRQRACIPSSSPRFELQSAEVTPHNDCATQVTAYEVLVALSP